MAARKNHTRALPSTIQKKPNPVHGIELNVKLWRDKADEARAVREQMKNFQAKEMMNIVIESYDTLAKLAEHSDR